MVDNQSIPLLLATELSQENPLTTPIYSEIGLLLMLGAAGVLIGFMLPRILRLLRLISLFLVALLLLAWVSGVAVDPPHLPDIDILSLLRYACSTWTQHSSWTPLRAGIAVTGFIAGLCIDMRSRRTTT